MHNSAKHLLLIDDDPAYCRVLHSLARQKGWALEYCDNLEDGMKKLSAMPRFRAVILDGHCFLSDEKDHPPGQNFVFHALQDITALEVSHSRSIPFCVNTAQPEAFRDGLEGIAPVFTKQIDEDKLFHWLDDAIGNLPETRLRKEYPEVFEDIGLLLDEQHEDDLLRLILRFERKNPNDTETLLALSRVILEAALMQMSWKILQKDPASLTHGRVGIASAITDRLARHPRVSRTLTSVASHTYKYCSRFGNHAFSAHEENYRTGLYAAGRIVFSLLEVLAGFIYILKNTDTLPLPATPSHRAGNASTPSHESNT